MKKGFENNRVFFIALYIFFGILLTVVAVFLIMGARDYFLNGQYTGVFKVLSPFFYGIVLAYLLNPLVNFFKKRLGKIIKPKKEKNRAKCENLVTAISIISTYIIALVFIALLIIMVIPQIGSSINQLAVNISDLFSAPDEVPAPAGEIDGIDGLIDEEFKNINNQTLQNTKIGKIILDYSVSAQEFIDGLGVNLDIQQTITDLFMSSTANIVNWSVQIISPVFNKTASILYSVTSGIINFIIGILVSVYILAKKNTYIAQIKKLLYALTPAGFANKLVSITRRSHTIIGGFIYSQMLDALIVGLICFTCMTIFGIKYALLISIIVGVTNIIPFFGPFIGAIPSIFFLLINDPMQALWFAVFILILQQIDGNIIVPNIMSTNLGISSLWIIFAVIVMSSIFGIFGMFLGVPIFAVIYMLIKEFAENRLKNKELPVSTEDFIEYPPKDHPDDPPHEKKPSLIKTLQEKIRTLTKKDPDNKN